MQNIKLDHFNTFMITMIILIFIIYYVMKYNEITENFSTYGYVACPPQFTKVGSTQNMYYNAGNIGIGTGTPGKKLDINGTLRVSQQSEFTGGIYLHNDWVRVKGNGGIYWENHGGGWHMTDSTWIRSYGDKKVLINKTLVVNGYVGIGISSPAYKLDVRSGDPYIAIFKHTNNTQGIGIGYNSINALGNAANQDINITPRGSGVVKCNGELQIRGANRTSHICYNNGNTYIRGGSTNGTVLLNDNGGDVLCGGNLTVNGFTNGVKIEQSFSVMIGPGVRSNWDFAPSIHNKNSVTIRFYFHHKIYDVRSDGPTPATGPVTLSWFSEPINPHYMHYWTHQGPGRGPRFWFGNLTQLPKTLMKIVVISYINDTARDNHLL